MAEVAVFARLLDQAMAGEHVTIGRASLSLAPGIAFAQELKESHGHRRAQLKLLLGFRAALLM